jgi:hypothetical protein
MRQQVFNLYWPPFSGGIMRTATIIGGAERHGVERRRDGQNSAGYLLPHCNLFKLPPLNYEDGRCMGILSGLKAAIEVAGEGMKEARIGAFFAPSRYHRLISWLAAVNGYAKSHPDDLHLDFEVSVLFALQDAWPCKK